MNEQEQDLFLEQDYIQQIDEITMEDVVTGETVNLITPENASPEALANVFAYQVLRSKHEIEQIEKMIERLKNAKKKHEERISHLYDLVHFHMKERRLSSIKGLRGTFYEVKRKSLVYDIETMPKEYINYKVESLLNQRQLEIVSQTAKEVKIKSAVLNLEKKDELLAKGLIKEEEYVSLSLRTIA